MSLQWSDRVVTKVATEVATVDVVIQWFHRCLQRQAKEVVTEEVACSDIRRARGHIHSCATPLPTLSNTSDAHDVPWGPQCW